MVHNPGGDWHPGRGGRPNLIYLYIYIYGLYGCQPKNNGCQHPPNHFYWLIGFGTMKFSPSILVVKSHYFWFNTISGISPYLLGIFDAKVLHPSVMGCSKHPQKALKRGPSPPGLPRGFTPQEIAGVPY